MWMCPPGKWTGSMSKPFQPPHLKPSKLLAIRQRWYRWAKKMRQEVAALSLTERSALEHLCDNLSIVTRVSYYGGPTYDWPPPDALKLARQYNVDFDYLNPWFITADGWQSYQMAWKKLSTDPKNLWISAKLSTGCAPDGVKLVSVHRRSKVIQSYPQEPVDNFTQ